MRLRDYDFLNLYQDQVIVVAKVKLITSKKEYFSTMRTSYNIQINLTINFISILHEIWINQLMPF